MKRVELFTQINAERERQESKWGRLADRAGELGLFKTMHALEPAVQQVGWEMAEILEGKRPDCLMPHPQADGYAALEGESDEHI